MANAGAQTNLIEQTKEKSELREQSKYGESSQDL